MIGNDTSKDRAGKLAGSLNRNQLKYLITKLYEDGVVTSEGAGRGTKYKLAVPYDTLIGDGLVDAAIAALREKHAGEAG